MSIPSENNRTRRSTASPPNRRGIWNGDWNARCAQGRRWRETWGDSMDAMLLAWQKGAWYDDVSMFLSWFQSGMAFTPSSSSSSWSSSSWWPSSSSSSSSSSSIISIIIRTCPTELVMPKWTGSSQTPMLSPELVEDERTSNMSKISRQRSLPKHTKLLTCWAWWWPCKMIATHHDELDENITIVVKKQLTCKWWWCL